MVHAVSLGKYLLALKISAVWSIPFIIGYTVFMCKMVGLHVVQTESSVLSDYRLRELFPAASTDNRKS